MAGLTKTQLVRQMAEKLELSNKQSAAFMDLLAETAVKETKKNGVFVIPGLGRLVKAERKARMGRNPQTGEQIKIKAKTVVKFRVAKAAKDWPQLNFIIYHGGYRWAGGGNANDAWKQFEETGRIEWITDLSEIPAKHGVTNVYGEIGTSFANSAVAHPKFAASLVATLVKGLGTDHVLWGTDSVWYGSPHWQIEALRRHAEHFEGLGTAGADHDIVAEDHIDAPPIRRQPRDSPDFGLRADLAITTK